MGINLGKTNLKTALLKQASFYGSLPYNIFGKMTKRIVSKILPHTPSAKTNRDAEFEGLSKDPVWKRTKRGLLSTSIPLSQIAGKSAPFNLSWFNKLYRLAGIQESEITLGQLIGATWYYIGPSWFKPIPKTNWDAEFNNVGKNPLRSVFRQRRRWLGKGPFRVTSLEKEPSNNWPKPYGRIGDEGTEKPRINSGPPTNRLWQRREWSSTIDKSRINSGSPTDRSPHKPLIARLIKAGRTKKP